MSKKPSRVKNILMLVSNPVTNDPRVTKEAESLVQIASITILSFYYGQIKFKRLEKKGGYRIIRARFSKVNFHKNIFDLAKYFWSMNYFYIREGIRMKPDIVHSHNLDTLLAGYLIKRKTGAKLIYDAHEIWFEQGLALPGLVLKIFRILEKYLLKKIDGLISVNLSIIKALAKIHKIKFPYPTVSLYNCPSLRKYQPGNNFSNFENRTIVLYQGGYMDNRGLEELILANQYFVPEIVTFLRIVFPDKKSSQKLIDLIGKHRLQNRIFLLKPVSLEKIVEGTIGADIGIIPYLPVNINNQLTSPNKLFEYCHGGLAIAASNLPELKNFIRKYNNGILFNPKEPQDIADKINRLVKNRPLLEQKKQNSLLFAKVINWQKEEKKLLRFYQVVQG